MKIKFLSTLVSVFISFSIMAQPGNSLSFDGVDDFVSVPALGTQSEFTLETWFKADAFTSGLDALFTTDAWTTGSIHLQFTNGKLGFWIGGSEDITTDYTFKTDRWYHIAVTYSSINKLFNIYINGDLAESHTISSATPEATFTVARMGSWVGSRYFKGQFDEFRIWNTVRTESEIKDNIYTELVGTEAGLLLYYNFNEGIGDGDNTGLTSLYDISANNFDGTLINFALSGSTSNWKTSGALCVFNSPATNITVNMVIANYKVYTGASGYRKECSENSNFSSVVVYNSNSYFPSIFMGVSPNINYYYRIRANKDGWSSPYSATETFMLPPGNTLSFDGTNDYIDLGTLAPDDNFNKGFSFVGWVKWGSFNAWSRIFDFGNGQASDNILLANNETTNSLNFSVFNGGTQSSIVTGNILPTNQWVHVAVTVSATGEAIIYINGEIAASGTTNIPTNIKRNNCFLGKSNWAADAYLNACMDEVSIWSKTLAPEEVSLYMQNSVHGDEDNLVANYYFNDGIADGDNTNVKYLTENSGNDQVAKLVNFTLSGSSSNFIESYALVVPKTISAENVLKSKFTARWSASVSGQVERYILDVATDENFISFVSGYQNLDCGTSLSKEVTGLTASTTYYYRVRAEKASVTGQGAFSNTVSTTTLNESVTLGINWTNPVDIVYGTAISTTQMNAIPVYNGHVLSGSLVYSPTLGAILNAGSNQDLSVIFTPNDTENFKQAKDTVKINVIKATPVITWASPANITYGTALGDAQLNAAASHKGNSVDGTYTYLPAKDSVLNAGIQDLAVEFTPTDISNYESAKDTVQINVLKATPVITWENPEDITYGTRLSHVQLNATVSNNGQSVPGLYVYSHAVDSLMNAGNNQDLSVNFIPSDLANYNSVRDTVQINVLKATPVITWENPADITYGTPLSATQLNATASFNGEVVDGFFAYSPAIDSVLNGGHFQDLTLEFTPNDIVNYEPVKDTVKINVLPAPTEITWADPADIYYGTHLSNEQLNATASFNGNPVPGIFSYMPSVGTKLEIGDNQRLLVIFNPFDQQNFSSKEDTAFINVLPAKPEIFWLNPIDIVYGTPLSATQLNAEVSFNGEVVDGTFNYSPDFDSVLNAGNSQELRLEFIPTDLTKYVIEKDTVLINVLKADPVITWENPADIVYGTLLDEIQLNAVADISGAYSYYPASGTQINPGSQTLSLTFVPTDATNYNTITQTNNIFVSSNPILANYCDASSLDNSGEYISNIKLGDINQASQSRNYENFTAEITDLEIGILDTLEITIGNYYEFDQVMVWIDWNQDGDFDDENEEVYTSSIGFSSPLSATFLTPNTAKLGKTRMRIRLHDAANDITNNTPCGNSTWGEVEDYTINVVPATTPMQFISGSNNVIDSVAYAGMNNQQVLRVELLMNGGGSSLELTNLQFDINDMGLRENISKAKVFYTGNSATYSDTLQFGYADTPSSPSSEFVVEGTQELCAGINYFWLSYDLVGFARLNDTITTQCTNLTLGAVDYTPDMSSGETIIRELAFELTQNINPVYPGKSNQDIIGVIVDNKGTQARTLNSIAFNLDGSSDLTELSSFKVYSTGTQNHFAPYKQYGQTVSEVSGVCAFTDDIDLVSGKNYIWFTSDISESAVNNHLIDAGLVAMSINDKSLIPTESSPDSARIVKGFNGNTFSNFMPASMVIGQPDFYTQDLTIDQDGGHKACGVAISSKGMVAMVSQAIGSNEFDINGGRVLLWNSVPEFDGAPADIVIGQPDFTSIIPMQCSSSGFSILMNVAFSPDGNKLFVTDKGNNRILIFHAPFTNGMEASVVIGQTDFSVNSAGCSASKLNSPYSVYVHTDGKVFIADAGNARVLIYNQIPTTNGAAADFVVGQPDFTSNITGCSENTFQHPSSCAVSPDKKLIICDGGSSELPSNSRVLIYNKIPESNGASADVVIGRPDFTTQSESFDVSDSTMYYPFGVSVSKDGQLAVGEFGSSRVLIYDKIPTENGAKANTVLGHPDFNSNIPFNGGISDRSMVRPYNIAYDLNGRLFVSGRDMHRIMVYGEAPALEADLQLDLSIDESDYEMDSTIVYMLKLKNNGPNSANDVEVNFALPSQFIETEHVCAGTYDTLVNKWILPQINPYEELRLNVFAKLKPNNEGETIRATASILYSDKKDPNLENNSCYADFVSNIVWTGTVSSNWNDSLNWNIEKVPTMNQSAIIPATPVGTYFPEVFNKENYINNISIENGAYIHLPDTSDLIVLGNFKNLGDSATGNGNVGFVGNTHQTIEGKVSSIAIVNGRDVSLSGNTFVRDAAFLLYGKLKLGNYDLEMGDTAKFSSEFGKERVAAKGEAVKVPIFFDAYVVTDGMGKLIQKVDTVAKEFPVGTETDYYGATITNKGVADNYSIRVFPDVLEHGISGNQVSDIDNFVKASWDIEEEVVGGSELDLKIAWRPAAKPSSPILKLGISMNTGESWDKPNMETVMFSKLGFVVSRDSITTMGTFAIGDSCSSLVLQASPVLIADNTDNDPLHSITITYESDADWSLAINDIWINGTPIGNYSSDSESITIPASYFPIGDTDYQIEISAPDYTLAKLTQHIKKVDQQIQFDPITGFIINQPFALSAQSSSGLPVEYVCTNLNSALIQGNVVIPVEIGKGVIIATQKGNEVYNEAISVQQEFTSYYFPQIITFNSIASKTYGDASFNVSATGGATGNPVVFTSSNDTIATCSGTNGETITIVGAGTCKIYANQEGNATYAPAVQQEQELIVNKATPVLTWSNPLDITYGTLLSETQLNATADVDGTFAYDPAIGTQLEVGDAQELKVDFTPTDAVNYNTVLKSVFINVLKSTGIDDLDAFELSVYPNPATNQISIKDLNEINGSDDLQIEIIDLSGKTYLIVESIKTDVNPIDLQTLPSGMYILKIRTNNRVKSLKFIKQ